MFNLNVKFFLLSLALLISSSMLFSSDAGTGSGSSSSSSSSSFSDKKNDSAKIKAEILEKSRVVDKLNNLESAFNELSEQDKIMFMKKYSEFKDLIQQFEKDIFIESYKKISKAEISEFSLSRVIIYSDYKDKPIGILINQLECRNELITKFISSLDSKSLSNFFENLRRSITTVLGAGEAFIDILVERFKSNFTNIEN